MAAATTVTYLNSSAPEPGNYPPGTYSWLLIGQSSKTQWELPSVTALSSWTEAVLANLPGTSEARTLYASLDGFRFNPADAGVPAGASSHTTYLSDWTNADIAPIYPDPPLFTVTAAVTVLAVVAIVLALVLLREKRFVR